MKQYYTKKICFILFILFAAHTLQAENYKRVRVDLQNRNLEEIAKLGLALEIADFKPGEYMVAEFSATELDLLKQSGFSYQVLISDMTSYYQQRNQGFDREELNRQMRTEKSDKQYQTPQNFMLGSMGGYHTYTEVLDDLDAMQALFPELISAKQTIGINQTIQGRPVHWVRISNNPDETQDKPKVLYTALTHAREPVSMQQMLFQMWYLLENYETDPEIQYLVDNMEMYFVPVVNPDGYVFCETSSPNGGSMHRKNMRVNGDGSIGVDLNRNFGYMWGYDNSGSSPIPSSLTYRGTGPFSEPETAILKEFAESYNFTLALNNHTYSDLLIYPWGYSNQLTPDGDIFIEYAKLLTRENNYIYGTCYETLSYFANGGSDDWFYGEQTTKDKVFSFTPEAGKPSDGFWPAINRIEDICAGHTHMNLALAKLALAYAEINDLSGSYIGERSAEIEFEIINLGQLPGANFTVSITPLSNNITSVGNPVVFSAMEVLQTEISSISMELKPHLNTGEEINFVLSLDNGSFAWHDTITKFYGMPQVIFHDLCDNLNNWTTSSWGISNNVYYSAPGSIADSPTGNYNDNANTHITLSQPFDLSDVTVAWVEFQTRYDIETGWDYVQFMYSTDNQQTWIPLQGTYTQAGGSNQDTGQPLYHGNQPNWVQENIDLSHLIDQEEVWFRFRLISDGSVSKEGFYFDDFKIFTLQYQAGFHFFPPQEVMFYQHQEITLDMNSYISWEAGDETTIEWEGAANIHIEQLDNLLLHIENNNITWTGTEIIQFTIADPDQDLVLSAEVEFKSLAIPAPVISGQLEATVLQGNTFDFNPGLLIVEDELFSFPAEFTVTLYEGENYTLIQPFNIVHTPGFSGELSIPVTVNNGFAESNSFNFLLNVSTGSSIEEVLSDGVKIYWDNSSETLVMSFDPILWNKDLTLVLSDINSKVIFGRKIIASETTNQSIANITPGVYIVIIEGEVNAVKKIIVR